MQGETMRGTLILSEGRSGTNWLGGLATSTGVLGKSKEWMSPTQHKLKISDHSSQSFLDAVVDMASSDNGYFNFKIFPWQQYRFHRDFGEDPIPLLRQKHDIQFILLERRDRVGQAISLAKARQTKGWIAKDGVKPKPEYDFGRICRAYFHLGRSYEFWRGYNDLHQLGASTLFYEDLLPDGRAYIDALAVHAGVSDLPQPEPRHRIQRNSETEEWRVRFQEDLQNEGIFPHALPTQKPYGRLSNFIRLAKGEYLKPFPMSY